MRATDIHAADLLHMSFEMLPEILDTTATVEKNSQMIGKYHCTETRHSFLLFQARGQ